MSDQRHKSTVARRPRSARKHSLADDVRPGQSPDAETMLFATPKLESEQAAEASAVSLLEPVADRADPKAPGAVTTTAPLPAILALPATRDAAPRPTRRRTWISRVVLVCVLIMQALLTLRMHNTAFEDEALYLYVGHLEIAHWLHGSALQGNYASYFSGAPVLYPPLGAAADSIGGLAAARAVSLAEMLGTTALLYSLTRRLFNERVGLCAAVIFSVTEPTLFLGNLATYDASALLLLALATWIVVRTATFRWPVYLLAAMPASLAVATKYASLLFVPSIVVIAGLAAWPSRSRQALIRPIALAGLIAAMLATALDLAGHNYRQGIDFTTLDRFQGTSSAGSLLWDSLQWAGLPFALALIGAIGFAFRPYTETGEHIAPAGTRLRRTCLGIVMAGSALLAPAEQIRIHTFVSLQKHIGFGLFLAAPIAGVGLARVIGDHFRRAQVGIAVWGAAMALGMTQANNLFNVWPNSATFVSDFTHYLHPGARYLVEVDEVPIYYLRHHADAQPDQFTSTYYIGYVDQQGQFLTGNAGYVAALKAGYFQVVAYNFQTTPSVDQVLARTLATDPDYRLAAAIPNGNDTVTQYIWVHT
ncbi:MAG TPA: glycosyltransferase family 39 protein [Streptosporangiaceae bacterium]|nr:glycosyltransferase family 39 protein [Streptosporangiaceae bacterium]